MTGNLLVDNSAFTRLRSDRLSGERRAEVAGAFRDGRVWACTPFLLEAGVSARNAAEHHMLLGRVDGLGWAGIDAQVEARARQAQSELARVGQHRLPPADVLIAAIADRHQLGVLHYDGHYDLIVERTSLRFDSVWLAPPGSLTPVD